MGLTVLKLEIAKTARPKVRQEPDFLIDSGAIYSVVPSPILRKLGIKPLRRKEEFRLADGSKIERRKGVALFRYGDKEGFADVIFGEPGDSQLLGMRTLEALGLALNPLRRELKPLPMILARCDGASAGFVPVRGSQAAGTICRCVRSRKSSATSAVPLLSADS